MFVYKSMGHWIRLAKHLARRKDNAERDNPTRAGNPVSLSQNDKDKPSDES